MRTTRTKTAPRELLLLKHGAGDTAAENKLELDQARRRAGIDVEHAEVKVNSQLVHRAQLHGVHTAELTVGDGPILLSRVHPSGGPADREAVTETTKYTYTAPPLDREPVIRGELEHHSEGP